MYCKHLGRSSRLQQCVFMNMRVAFEGTDREGSVKKILCKRQSSTWTNILGPSTASYVMHLCMCVLIKSAINDDEMIRLGMLLVKVAKLPPHPSLAAGCLQKTCKLIFKEITFRPKDSDYQRILKEILIVVCIVIVIVQDSHICWSVSISAKVLAGAVLWRFACLTKSYLQLLVSEVLAD